MDRLKMLIKRVSDGLKIDGYRETQITEAKETGFGDYSSYFDLMIDVRLEGQSEPAAQTVFDNMKKQINYLSRSLIRAGKDYRKLSNRYEMLKRNYEELIKEK